MLTFNKHSRVNLLAIFLVGTAIACFVPAQNAKGRAKNPYKNDSTRIVKQRPDFVTNPQKMVGNIVLGCITTNSCTVNYIAEKGMKVYVEWGQSANNLNAKTAVLTAVETGPVVFQISNLLANRTCFYRMRYQVSGAADFMNSPTYSFTTQRAKNSTFSFGVQGDSHPERQGKMFLPALYMQTMQNVAAIKPDFYFMMGDDFSIDHLIQKGEATQKSVEGMYLNQRQYLGTITSSTALYLVNGNHEQAARYLLDGSPQSPAILAANARQKYYPLPTPTDFFGGDAEKVENVGYLSDYYAFEWGNALFVVIDPYWHSAQAVDNVAGSRDKTQRDMWDITLGKTQYEWLKSTLEKSKAPFKFVFSHHVLGTGRGGVENARYYEWGGYDRRGSWEFDKKRPGWAKPIHQLLVDNKVSVFFQGHDHLFCKQLLDGVVYQSVPCPADNTYSTFNADAYTGDKLPNSGFLNVTVAAKLVTVDYIRTFLKEDEQGTKNGDIAYSYTISK